VFGWISSAPSRSPASAMHGSSDSPWALRRCLSHDRTARIASILQEIRSQGSVRHAGTPPHSVPGIGRCRLPPRSDGPRPKSAFAPQRRALHGTRPGERRTHCRHVLLRGRGFVISQAEFEAKTDERWGRRSGDARGHHPLFLRSAADLLARAAADGLTIAELVQTNEIAFLNNPDADHPATSCGIR